MSKDFETIYFPRESKIKIKNVTYVVSSHFDTAGETLKMKIENLILEEIKKINEKRSCGRKM